MPFHHKFKKEFQEDSRTSFLRKCWTQDPISSGLRRHDPGSHQGLYACASMWSKQLGCQAGRQKVRCHRRNESEEPSKQGIHPGL